MANHVFISYKREEKDFANRVRAVLALATRAEIWWDEDLQTGGKWNEDLDQALRDAGCVVVIWSKLSVRSDWVKQEASFAKYAGSILPLLKEPCDVPPPFQSIQTADLTNWSGDERVPEFAKIAERTRLLIASRKRRTDRRRHSLIAMALGAVGLVGVGWGAQELTGLRVGLGTSGGAIASIETAKVLDAAREYRVCADQERQFVCRPEAEALAERCGDLVGRR